MFKVKNTTAIISLSICRKYNCYYIKVMLIYMYASPKSKPCFEQLLDAAEAYRAQQRPHATPDQSPSPSETPNHPDNPNVAVGDPTVSVKLDVGKRLLPGQTLEVDYPELRRTLAELSLGYTSLEYSAENLTNPPTLQTPEYRQRRALRATYWLIMTGVYHPFGIPKPPDISRLYKPPVVEIRNLADVVAASTGQSPQH
jgi:hypothetical protein